MRARIAIVGAGWWSTQAHLPSLTDYEGASVVAVVDPDPARCDAAADLFGVRGRYSDIAALADDGVADGVIIATPHSTHAALARDAMNAGLHVFVEKPMTLSAVEAWDLVDRAQRAELHLMVGYTTHFTAVAQRARDVVASGVLGDLVLVSAIYASAVAELYAGRVADFPITFPGAKPLVDTYSTAQGGQARTQVTHAAGMLAWVTGLRVSDVHAHTANRDFAVDVVDVASWRYDNGALGTLASTGLVGAGQPGVTEYRYWGTAGCMVQSGGLEIYGSVRESMLADENSYPLHMPARRFADLICGRSTDNPASGDVGARAVELVEAITAGTER